MKRRGVIIAAVIAAAAAVLACAVYFIFFHANDPADDLKRALDAVASGNKNEASKYIDYDSFYRSGDDSGLYKSLMRDFSYSVNSVERDGSSARASVTVSNRDMNQIYGNFVTDACQQVLDNEAKDKTEQLSSSDMEQQVRSLFMDHIVNDTASVRSADINVQMKRSWHTWKISIDEKYYDDIYGGYYSAQEKAGKLLESLDNGSIDELEAEYGTVLDESDVNVRRAVHFVVDDIWNDTLRNIVSFINAGTDADGNDYDLNDGISRLDGLIEKKKNYDDMINGLDDSTYSKIKKTWNKMTKSFDSLVKEIKSYDPDSDDRYSPDTEKLEKYLNRLVKQAY